MTAITDPWAKSGLQAQVATFLKEYFRLLDAENEEGAAKKWADCWTKDGEFVQGARVIKGHDELLEERIRVWGFFPHLTHHVKRIYLDASAPQSEVLVVATYKINRRDGSEILQDTAAHFSLVNEGGAVKIQRFDIYADGNPLLEVMVKP